MKAFHLSFRTDNAAFFDNMEGEIIRILRQTADRIETGGTIPLDTRIILRDINGNHVGSFNADP